MQKILIASHNQNKINEIKKVMLNLQIEWVTLKDLNDEEEVDEDQDSFFKNAYKKAFTFAKKYNMLTLSDDSGLCVEALSLRPGIHSARYSQGGDMNNNQKLLKELDNISHRNAYFIAVIILCEPNGSYKAFEGEIHGLITQHPIGNHGFGYDPLFYVPAYKMTMAQLPPQIKNQISHRAIALNQLKEHIYENISNK